MVEFQEENLKNVFLKNNKGFLSFNVTYIYIYLYLYIQSLNFLYCEVGVAREEDEDEIQVFRKEFYTHTYI